jgi:hypothetical protein
LSGFALENPAELPRAQTGDVRQNVHRKIGFQVLFRVEQTVNMTTLVR